MSVFLNIQTKNYHPGFAFGTWNIMGQFLIFSEIYNYFFWSTTNHIFQINNRIFSCFDFFFNYKDSSIQYFYSKIYWTYCFSVVVLSSLFPFTILAIEQEHLSMVFVGLRMAIIPLLVIVFLFFYKMNKLSHKKN